MSIERCGPAHGGSSCSVPGQCCDVRGGGLCFSPGTASQGDGTVRNQWCSDHELGFDAPPSTVCDARPRMPGPATPCMRTNAPVYTTDARQALPHPCGPLANAQCPWRQGHDLCCVRQQSQNDRQNTTGGAQGPAGGDHGIGIGIGIGIGDAQGMCLPCGTLSATQRSQVVVWDGASGWRTWF